MRPGSRGIARLHLRDEHDRYVGRAACRACAAPRGLQRERAQPRGESRAALRRFDEGVRQVHDDGTFARPTARVQAHDRGVVAQRGDVVAASQHQQFVGQRCAGERVARDPTRGDRRSPRAAPSRRAHRIRPRAARRPLQKSGSSALRTRCTRRSLQSRAATSRSPGARSSASSAGSTAAVASNPRPAAARAGRCTGRVL